MKIAIGADHRGYKIKEQIKKYLNKKQIDNIDCGTNSLEMADYPKIAEKVAKQIQSKECEYGILICGTGIGMAITANKFKGIRCANCYNLEVAKYAKMHNNANIIALGAGQITEDDAIEMIEMWLTNHFEGERHLERIKMIEKIENENMK